MIQRNVKVSPGFFGKFALWVGGFVGLIFVGFILYLLILSPVITEQRMKSTMNSLQFPPSYKLNKKEYTAGGIDNDATLNYTYQVSGTREDVYQQVVKALGLNSEEHKESYGQDLNGVGSPKYKGVFFLSITPQEKQYLENDPCLVHGEDDLAWKICRNQDPKRGKNLPAEEMKITLVNR